MGFLDCSRKKKGNGGSMNLLSQVKRGRLKKPILTLVYGPDGVGKSTFGADAPNAIFLGPEKGTASLDVARFPSPTNFKQVMHAIEELNSAEHEYQTLVIDSLDWIEPLVWDQVCNDAGKSNIEEVGGGYGKGYVAANKVWLEMIGKLSRLQETRGMNIILIAHSQVKTFQDPQTQSGYDRYQLKLNEKAGALFREFVDSVLFANYEVFTKKDGGRTRAFGDGARVLFTERRPSFDAKNRLGLPFQIPLSFDEFVKSCEAGQPEDPELIKKNIEELLSQVKDPELKSRVMEAVEKASQDSTKLEKIQNRLRSRLSN